MWTQQLGPTIQWTLSHIITFLKSFLWQNCIYGKLAREKDVAVCAELTNMQKLRPDPHFQKDFVE